jgi:hypothetical protein
MAIHITSYYPGYKRREFALAIRLYDAGYKSGELQVVVPALKLTLIVVTPPISLPNELTTYFTILYSLTARLPSK